MKALRFHRYGTPDVLSLEEIAVPDPSPGEALVRVHAAAVNPSDVKNVAGAFNASVPRTPGRDYAGTVVAGDPAWVGKVVWGSSAGLGVTRDGSHAEYVAVQSDSLSEKPASLSMEQAASVGVPYLAAWMALRQAAAVEAGETVLITGALGAVGRAATQIAHWAGARVIGADLSETGSAVGGWIDTRQADMAARVKELTGGRGADVVVDTVGGPLFEPSLRSLAPAGRQVALTSVGTRRVEFDLADFFHKQARLYGIDTMQLSGPTVAGILNRLAVGFDGGRLTLSPVTTWPLAQATDAYVAVGRGGVSTKHVLIPAIT
jgi:NADPH:quinone reductase-like Zn-dependent oxidoreductase